MQLGQLVHCRLTIQYGTTAASARAHPRGHPGSFPVTQRFFPESIGIRFEFYQSLDPLKRIPEHEVSSGKASKKIAYHGKRAVSHIFKEYGGAVSTKNAALNFGCLQVSIYLVCTAHEMAVGRQVLDALS